MVSVTNILVLLYSFFSTAERIFTVFWATPGKSFSPDVQDPYGELC